MSAIAIPYYMLMLDRVRERADEFDILHFHIDQFHFPLFRPIADRTVTTLHGRQDLPISSRSMSASATCRWCRSPMRSAGRSRTPISSPPSITAFPLICIKPTYQPRGGYLAFLGRISPEKRPDRAIAIARATGIPLKIAAKVDKVDEAYFREQIEPLLDQPGIEFIGEINEREKTEFLGEARALLFPIDWPEPFGLVHDRGDGLRHAGARVPLRLRARDHRSGVTGVIVETMDEAVSELPQVLALDRARVRRRFERAVLRHAHGQGLCAGVPCAAQARRRSRSARTARAACASRSSTTE